MDRPNNRGPLAHGCGDTLHRPLPDVARSEDSVHTGLKWQARPPGAWRDSHVGQHESVVVARDILK